MLTTLIKKEFLNNLLNVRILICYLVIFMLVVFSIVTRGIQHQGRKQAYEYNTARFTEDYTERQEDYWWEYDVQIPPPALEIFCEGFSPAISRPFHIDIKHPGNRPLGDYYYESPILEVFRVYDLVFIIAYIVSLLAIFISYDCISGEREHNTLRLMLSNPVSSALVILGKFIGGYLSVIIPYLFAFLTGLLFLQAVMGIGFQMADYAVIGLFLLLSLFFLGLVFLGSLLCSNLCRRSSLALFCALLLWAALGLAVPWLAVKAGQKISPVPFFSSYYQAIATIREEESLRARAESEQYNQQYGRSNQAGQLVHNAWRQAHGRMGERWDVELSRYKNALNRQIRMVINSARISPFACYLIGASSCTRTGMQAYLAAGNWKEELDRKNKIVFDTEYFDWEKRNLFKDGNAEDRPRFPDRPLDLNTLPSRQFPEPGLREAAAQALPDLVVLFLEMAVLFMACFYVFISRRDF